MPGQKQPDIHRKLAVDLFNMTWDLMEKSDRSQAETDRMIHAAHASRYHWEVIGQPVNLARGEWQVSRVYAILQRAEPCLYHAKRCLQITLEHDLKDFDLAFAYEAMARAYSLAGEKTEKDKYLALAKEAGQAIKEKGDRDYFMAELATIE
jgi:hypothetical protein